MDETRQLQRAELMAYWYGEFRVGPTQKRSRKKPIALRRERRKLARAYAKRDFTALRSKGELVA